MKTPTAGIIIIGDEILSGRTHDSNSNFIANELIKVGIKLEEIRIIEDKSEKIIETVRFFHSAYNYVFTTGGIGPTHDDITSESISLAFNKNYQTHPEAYKILEAYYPKGEFNKARKKMAMMPENSLLIHNPISAAPGFIIDNVYVLPGVPTIMKEMFKILITHLKKGNPKKILTIQTDLYESIIADDLSKIQKNNPQCTIGSYPFFNYIKKKGGVNIVISSWHLDDLSKINKQILHMISILGGKSSIV